MEYQQINAQTIGGWVREGWEWGRPVPREEFLRAKQGEIRILLTPTRPVPREWFGELAGRKVLGLASGGAQQMPVLSAAGARCTVMDITPEQLESERIYAEREGYEIGIVQGDMTRPLPFGDESFDLIVHPVSNCYIREVKPVWRECFRILRPGGRLLCGLDNGINFIVDEAEEKTIVRRLPYDPLSDPELMAEGIRNGDGVQFSHTLEEQIRGQLQAGFLLRDCYEDTNGSGRLHEYGIPTFWATYAEKPYAERTL